MYNSKYLNNIRINREKFLFNFSLHIVQHLTSKLGPKLGTKEIIFYIMLE